MANSEEVALGIASIVASVHAPNPVPIMLRGQSLPEAAYIIWKVVDECAAAGLGLEKIELDPELFEEVRLHRPVEVRLVNNAHLIGEAHFFRRR